VRKGTGPKRTLEQYEDEEDGERDHEASDQETVLNRYVDQESPVSGITDPRIGDDEVDAVSEDDGYTGHPMMTDPMPLLQVLRMRSTLRQDQSREASAASRGRSGTALQQCRKRSREDILVDLVASLEEDRALRQEELRRRLERDQEEREERERERERDREERENERKNMREEREHQRAMQHETNRMNLEKFKRIAEMMAKANSR